MKNSLPTHVALLLSLAIASCGGRGEAAPAAEGTSGAAEGSPQQPAARLDDLDPYFTESTAITSTSGPHSITRNMLQDGNGHMWFATWEGIIGFDGETFTNYMNKDGLRRYHTFAVLEDRSGALWFGTIGAGVYRHDGKSFTNFTTKDGLANDRIGCMMEDSHGTIWIGTEAGISRFDGQSFHNLTAAEGLVDGDVNSIVEARNGDFWIGTRGSSFVYDGATFTPINKQDGLAFHNVRSVLEDREGASGSAATTASGATMARPTPSSPPSSPASSTRPRTDASGSVRWTGMKTTTCRSTSWTGALYPRTLASSPPSSTSTGRSSG